MSRRSLRKTPLAQALSQQQGWGLMETLLTLGALSAMGLGIYMLMSPTSATANTKIEQDNLRALSTSVERSFGLMGSFEEVSNARLAADNLVPQRLRSGDENEMVSKWGGAIRVEPFAVNVPNDAFVVTYEATPSDVCSKLASAVSRSAFDIRVGGTSVYSATGFDPSAAATACADGPTSTMQFVYHSGLVAGQAVAAAPLVLAPSPPPLTPPAGPPVSIVVGDPGSVGDAGGVAPVILAPGGATPPPPAVAPPPAPVSITPTTPPPTTITPPTNRVACSVPAPATQTVYTCNAGQYGNRQQQATFSCPEAWEAPVIGSWSTVANNCNNCPAPSTQSDTEQDQPRSAPCPVGQSGNISWLEDRTRTRSVSYNCPAGTATLPGATYGGWSAYVWSGVRENEVNTCVASIAKGTRSPFSSVGPEVSCVGSSRYYERWSWQFSGPDGSTNSGECVATGSGPYSVVCTGVANPVGQQTTVSWSSLNRGYNFIIPFEPASYPSAPGADCYLGDFARYDWCDGSVSGDAIEGSEGFNCF